MILNLEEIQVNLELRLFSGLSIFLAWAKIVLLLQKLPKAGRYIRIFKIVAKELFFFLLIYLPILLAFGAGFFVLLPPKTMEYRNAWTSGLKVFSMLVGELDYVNTFINNEDFEEDRTLQTIFLQIMSICFLCFVSIVISNLLTGLAIQEIKELKSEAWIDGIIEKTNELIEDDNGNCNKLYRCFKKDWIKKFERGGMIAIKPNEHVQDNVKHNFSKIWNFFSGQDKNYKPVYIVEDSHRTDNENASFGYEMKSENGRASFDYNFEKTNVKFPPELIKLIMDHLRKKEKLKEIKEKGECSEFSSCTINDVMKNMQQIESTLENIKEMMIGHLGIDKKLKKDIESRSSLPNSDIEI